jgi:hypothetical protein
MKRINLRSQWVLEEPEASFAAATEEQRYQMMLTGQKVVVVF